MSSKTASRRGAWQSSLAAKPKIPVAVGPAQAPAAHAPHAIPEAPSIAKEAVVVPVALAASPVDPEVAREELKKLIRDTVTEALDARVPVRAPVRPGRIASRLGINPAQDEGESR